MNRLFSTLTAMVFGAGVMVASTDSVAALPQYDKMILNHLDVGLTLGTTGVGFDLALPLTDYVKVRAGVAYTPGFEVPLNLNLMSYSDLGESTFDKAAGLMKSLTGYEIDRKVVVNGTPEMLNFKLLFDVYPFQTNKNWHFTAGFYMGPEKVATALNDIGEMSTLVSVGMYNSFYKDLYAPIYDWFVNEMYWDEPIMGDIYLDPDKGAEIKDQLIGYNLPQEIGVNLGTFTKNMYFDPSTGNYTSKPEQGKEYVEFKAGDRYIMKPNRKDATVSAKALANIFRPYVGFGYGGYIDNARRFSVSFDCGAMFWGGAPEVVTHEGVDLINDVKDVRGKVGDYVDIANAMKVYPVLNFRISYNIF